ncbi:MAG: hypothetical protein GY811_23770 [Myxococcales bacterium]|nr:hypothetical protein [Myxococcales bacterium]
MSVYLLVSGCWLPGDDRHPDERGCQSDSGGGSSGRETATRYDFTQPHIVLADESFAAVAQAEGRLWGFMIPANPQQSITGPYDLKIQGRSAALAHAGGTTALAWLSGKSLGFTRVDRDWQSIGQGRAFEAQADALYLGADEAGFVLLWADRDQERGWVSSWERISLAGEVVEAGSLALGGPPSGLVVADRSLFVTWSSESTDSAAGLSGVGSDGLPFEVALPPGTVGAPVIHRNAISLVLQDSEGQVLLELDPLSLALTETRLGAGLPLIDRLGSTAEGLLVLGSRAEEASVVGYLETDGGLRAATELPASSHRDLATGVNQGFALLQQRERLSGYWTIEEDTISTPIVLAENYTEGCQVGGRSKGAVSSCVLLLLVLVGVRRRSRN